MEGVPVQKQAVYQFYDFRLLRIHDQITVLPFIIAEKPAVWHADLAVSKLFSVPPFDVLGNASVFLLGQGTHDSDE